MMTGQHDIYDPPPSKTSWLPPRVETLTFTRGDLACLGVMVALVVAASAAGFAYDAMLGALVLVGGLLVAIESWYTALGFLARRPTDVAWRRIVIIVAAVVPWVLGLGLAAALMIALFAYTDFGA